MASGGWFASVSQPKGVIPCYTSANSLMIHVIWPFNSWSQKLESCKLSPTFVWQSGWQVATYPTWWRKRRTKPRRDWSNSSGAGGWPWKPMAKVVPQCLPSCEFDLTYITYNLKGPRELEMYVLQIQVDLLKTHKIKHQLRQLCGTTFVVGSTIESSSGILIWRDLTRSIPSPISLGFLLDYLCPL